MIISSRKTKNIDMFKPRICNHPIEQASSARFLGVIIDDKLSWSKHITAIKAKMSRYIGLLYKLKCTLPLVARKTLFQSFVQSHVNYCSLVWGLTIKSNIENIFTSQKKALRAVIPGYVNYYYKDGITPQHTKPAFTEYNILTIQNIIAKNVMLFMFKINNAPSLIPTSIRKLIPENAPIAGDTHETCSPWLEKYNTSNFSKSLFYKGPLLYTNILSSARDKIITKTANSFKRTIRKYIFELQCSGDKIEWQCSNFQIFNIAGLRQSTRIADTKK